MARSARLESGFQDRLIAELKCLFPGCMIFKMDQIQGIPDLLILYRDRWAALECKQYAGARRRPNQEYYVDKMNQMSFSRFICPENKEEVLHELQQSFSTSPCKELIFMVLFPLGFEGSTLLRGADGVICPQP
jgi:hypothetical protein